MTELNGGPWTVTVISPTQFSINGLNTSGDPPYTGGGVVTPNPRNVTVNISDFPDTYTVPFVLPPLQTAIIQLTWATISPNYVSPEAIAQLAVPALANYINALAVGVPINIYVLQQTFVAAVSSLIPDPELVTQMDFTVTINGVEVSPAPGTGAVYGDPESYFSCNTSSGVILTQA